MKEVGFLEKLLGGAKAYTPINHPPLEGGSKSEEIRGGVKAFQNRPLLGSLRSPILPQGEDDLWGCKGAKVEWKLLGDVCGLITTGKLNANAMEEGGNYPFFTCNEKPYKINSYAFDLEAILISGNGSQVGHLNYYKGKFNAYQRTYIVGDFRDVHAMYLFHYLNYTLKSYILQNSRKGSVPYITMPMLENFQIPIPCPENPKKSLEIQAEIVRILDNFTELTTELTARKKQYNYYRDQLLTFAEDEVEWKPLGEIGDFTYGYAAKAQDFGDARFVRITDININGKLIADDPKYVDLSEENKKYLLKKNDLLMARTGATYGKTMIFEEDYPSIYAGFLIKLKLDKKIVDPRFYWHFAQSDFFWNQANKLVSGGGQPQFNANALKEVKVPIPYPSDPKRSLAEQARVVAILDKFDAITNSITEGLPREIELRQKQYEYYRDLLLNFPKSQGGIR